MVCGGSELLRQLNGYGYTDMNAFVQLSSEDDTRNRHYCLHYGYER